MEKRLMTNFAGIKQRYGENPLPILRQLVGEGKIEGNDYVALNPRRNDRHRGSFRIDIATGKFYDFATGDKGGSVIDLAAFVYNCGIVEAAQRLGNFGISGINADFRSKKFALKPFKFQRAPKMSALPEEINPNYIWRKSTVADHPYLRKKKISIGNARVNFYKGKSQLVIPLTDTVPVADKTSDESVSDKSVSEKTEDLEVKGLQFIHEDGQKRFMGSVKGLFHVSHGARAGVVLKFSDTKVCGEITIILAEGYATARSIAQALDAQSLCRRYFEKSSDATVCREIEKIDSDTQSKPADRSTHNDRLQELPASRCNLVNKSLNQENFNLSVLPCPGWGVRGGKISKVNKKLKFNISSGQEGPAFSDSYSDTTVCREIEKIDSDTQSKPSNSCTHNDRLQELPASRCCLVLAAMSSINIKNVTEKIAEQFPNSEIIIAADNDEAGRKAVAEAQKAISEKVSCTAIYPSPEFNDFNDMYQAVGAKEVKKIFEIGMKMNNEGKNLKELEEIWNQREGIWK